MQLLILDTAQIQNYVFGSNRLRENIGASYLVAQATGEWALDHMPKPHNIKSAAQLDLDETKWIDRDNLASEVLYVGGGNVVVLFKDEAIARQFTRTYSRYLLNKAPGLQVVFWHEPFDWEMPLYEHVQQGFRHLAQKKQKRIYSTPLLGLGVTEMCRSTALPAVAQSPSEAGVYPISREVLVKEDAYQHSNNRLKTYMVQGKKAWLASYLNGYEFPYDFDNLGRSEGEQSYIAIVHADGDGIGQRFREVGKGKPNREYIQSIRKFSQAVNNASQMALQDAVKALVDKLASHAREGDMLVHRSAFNDVLAEVFLQPIKQDAGYYLPFRPIVFGGDDVTFICDGRLGISLALEYMRQFADHASNLPDGKGGATASAGIAIVKSHYPFAQAYSISEELAKGAKVYRHEQGLKGCLDWHFARSGIVGKVAQVRDREYTPRKGESLILRPVALNGNAKEPHRAWSVVEKGVVKFQDLQRTPKQTDPDWSVRRNKVKALRETLREGPEAVKKFRAKFNNNQMLPDVATSMSSWPETGWQGSFCGYFDAIEMMDWFIPLHEIEGGA